MALDAPYERSHLQLAIAQRTGPATAHRFVSEGGLLIWVDKDMAWRALHDGRPGRPARNSALRTDVVKTMDRIPRPQPDRGKDALSAILRRTHYDERPGPPDRRNPHPHRPHEPLQRTRYYRDRPRGMTSLG
jgi:hypothetical protein